jgi:hypothetical protein
VSNVLEFKKKPEKKATVKQYTFYCLKCQSDTFRLLMMGEVKCAGCDSVMNNLAVTAPDFA